MSRFIFVSFAFLGWGFYELSGGADFEPRQERSEALEIAKAAFSAPDETRQANRSSRAGEDAKSLIRNVTFQPAGSAQEAARPARPAADPQLRSRVALRQITQARLAISDSTNVFPAVADQGAQLQLASLEGGISSIQTAAAGTEVQNDASEPAGAALAEPQPEPEKDIRRIRASRVNMRQGPGTNYPVIARLLGGDEVVVFEDSGTGWLHLRAPGKGKVGWIAASLVSKKRP
ncbi:SH3 domain-containing protein [Leisingera sp. ANG-M6]|uniref:SH3 domain-containing protein n=1 Tax=Leisingera sp. ANG-M6 TaxID=1577900 RepID=UPI00057FE8DA|nr:SH3 domain-containing protein [Leisingera sp. ANG-M6]KIC29172.1 ligand-binding protein SH3 [Leisingera sp. ANG-M6]